MRLAAVLPGWYELPLLAAFGQRSGCRVTLLFSQKVIGNGLRPPRPYNRLTDRGAGGHPPRGNTCQVDIQSPDRWMDSDNIRKRRPPLLHQQPRCRKQPFVSDGGQHPQRSRALGDGLPGLVRYRQILTRRVVPTSRRTTAWHIRRRTSPMQLSSHLSS